ncbi:hypothetical protein BDN71DRAFT_1438512 [Pleurotus eryngii]|uniref:Uncharacterized protein n=1 Tax=Pleurotus eryngii TaxID=5323 RepID=A0A9P6DCM1_PLEER|nr:hypothetical protein BDN71DRAFT_1438512 [Pleurotus eryngii]
MPFFPNATNFTVEKPTMNDIAGNYTEDNNTTNNTTTDSNNTKNETMTNSHNNSSQRCCWWVCHSFHVDVLY